MITLEDWLNSIEGEDDGQLAEPATRRPITWTFLLWWHLQLTDAPLKRAVSPRARRVEGRGCKSYVTPIGRNSNVDMGYRGVLVDESRLASSAACLLIARCRNLISHLVAAPSSATRLYLQTRRLHLKKSAHDVHCRSFLSLISARADSLALPSTYWGYYGPHEFGSTTISLS